MANLCCVDETPGSQSPPRRGRVGNRAERGAGAVCAASSRAGTARGSGGNPMSVAAGPIGLTKAQSGSGLVTSNLDTLVDGADHPIQHTLMKEGKQQASWRGAFRGALGRFSSAFCSRPGWPLRARARRARARARSISAARGSDGRGAREAHDRPHSHDSLRIPRTIFDCMVVCLIAQAMCFARRECSTVSSALLRPPHCLRYPAYRGATYRLTSAPTLKSASTTCPHLLLNPSSPLIFSLSALPTYSLGSNSGALSVPRSSASSALTRS